MLTLRLLRNLQAFDFPYKRSVLTWLPRERFFKADYLAFVDDADTPPAKL